MANSEKPKMLDGAATARKAPETKPAAPPESKVGDNGPPAPDFQRAAKILLEDVKARTSQASKANSEKGAALKVVQDECHCNKDAAKKAFAVSQLSPEMQSDWLRTFIGMMEPLNISVRRDLVDLAEGVEGITIPVRDAPASELEDDGASLATKVMRETAAAKS